MRFSKAWFFLLLLLWSLAAFAAVGELKVPINEYAVPTQDARPHDPAVGQPYLACSGVNKVAVVKLQE